MRKSLERELNSQINARTTNSKDLPVKNISSNDGGKHVDNDSDLLEESMDEVEVIKSS